jgi:hypothetical protein
MRRCPCGLAVFVVQAVVVEKRSVREVARISKTWLYECVAGYRTGGESCADSTIMAAAPLAQPDPRGPRERDRRVAKSAIPVRHRRRRRHDPHSPRPQPRRRGTVFGVDHLVHADPSAAHHPRAAQTPKSATVRFEANLPNECCQMDTTHVQLKADAPSSYSTSSTTSAASASPAAPSRSPPPPTSPATGVTTCSSPTLTHTPAVDIDAFRRDHATIELAIRDLKDGADLEHCPSGHFFANAA